MENYEKIIKEFEDGGETGLEQMNAFCDVVEKSLVIYNQQLEIIRRVCDDKYTTEPNKVVYIAPNKDNPQGHYVHYGESKNWSMESGKNNCFFDAVAGENQDPNELRELTIAKMRSDPPRYVNLAIHDHSKSSQTKALLTGGVVSMPDDLNSDVISAIITLDSEIQDPNLRSHPRIHTEENVALSTLEKHRRTRKKVQKTAFVADDLNGLYRTGEEVQASIGSTIYGKRELKTFLSQEFNGSGQYPVRRSTITLSIPTEALEKNKNLKFAQYKNGQKNLEGLMRGVRVVLVHDLNDHRPPIFKTFFPLANLNEPNIVIIINPNLERKPNDFHRRLDGTNYHVMYRTSQEDFTVRSRSTSRSRV